jgi:putative integral membrane protein (TIGR02587 family)
MSSDGLRQAAEQQQAEGRGARPISKSLGEYGRGIAGGLIFCLPLIYTQEVWELGASLGPVRLGLAVLVGFLLLCGYNRFAGLHPDASLAEVLIDSVEELGIGLLIAAAALWLIGGLNLALPRDAMLGAVVLEGLLAAIGVSVGTAQLGMEEREGRGEAGRGLGSLLILGVCGAVLIAANVAPTEEIALIAARSDPEHLLALLALSLLLTAVICFYSDFAGSGRGSEPTPVEIARETAITAAMALVVSAALLWFFGRFTDQSPAVCVARTVVLSVPAALGASAGRLLLQA